MTRRFGHVPLDAKTHVQHVAAFRQNEKFCPLPAPTGAAPYRLKLADIGITDPTDTLVFHVIGDSGGIVDAIPQEAVAAALVADLANAAPIARVARGIGAGPAPALTPSFLYSVGDLVYFNGDAAQWFPQFYEPYDKYARPIMGIPGNHDGDNSDNPAVGSLDAFVRNLCSTAPALTAEAGDSNRDSMTQPNVYWTLLCNLVTIVGLYTNVPSGGIVHPDQAAWLEGELAAAPTDRPVIVALHHPPYSADAHHGGSASMGAIIDAAAAGAGRWPDLVLAGHVHDYQRFTRLAAPIKDDPVHPSPAREIPYVVIGNGGYHNLHAIAPDVKSLPWTAAPDVTLDAYDDKHFGFLRLTVTGGKISGEYVAVTKDGSAAPVVADSW